MAVRIFAALALLSTTAHAGVYDKAHLIFNTPPFVPQNVWVDTDWDFTIDHENQIVTINRWTIRDVNGQAVYEAPHVQGLQLHPDGAQGVFTANTAEGHWTLWALNKRPDPYYYGWLLGFHPDPKPRIEGELMAGFPGITPWELQTMTVETPEPASVAMMGLAAALAAARNRWRRSS